MHAPTDGTGHGRPLDDRALFSDASVAIPPAATAAPAAPAGRPTENGARTTAADDEVTESQILEVRRKFLAFFERCATPICCEQWDFLAKQHGWRRIGMPPSEFVHALVLEFGDEALPLYGFGERIGDELRLARGLDDGARLFVKFDYDTLDARFTTAPECLFSVRRSALNYALERLSPDCTQGPETLFVGGSDDSVEVMERLGLRAVCCDTLKTLGRDHVLKLFEADQWGGRGWRYHILLVDFDVARLSNHPTSAIGDVIELLADAADVYELDPARRFAVCRPSAQDFQRLERAIRFKDREQICQLFEAWSTAAKNTKINSWRTDFDTQPVSFSEACSALTRALQQPNEVVRRARVSVALSVYRASFRREVIDRFYQAIDGTSDPFNRLDLIAAANLATTFLDSDPRVVEAEAVLTGRMPPDTHETHGELFERQQQCIAELRRIRREHKVRR